ncbi:hypothetical protein HanRHA438_Chr15g0684311 [Helianthus annuus]|nr:hypothetical protein HanRHA438_Chr15g0684311 [Helianthus annuus]
MLHRSCLFLAQHFEDQVIRILLLVGTLFAQTMLCCHIIPHDAYPRLYHNPPGLYHNPP